MTTTPAPTTPAPTDSLPADSAPMAAPVTATAPASTTPGTLSVIGLVLSIVAIATGQGFLGIAGIVLGFLARDREPQSRLLANWGLALGFVAVFGWIVFALVGVAALAPFAFLGLLG